MSPNELRSRAAFSGDALQLVEALHLLGRALGNEQRSEHLPVGGRVLAPAGAHQRYGGLAFLQIAFVSAKPPALRIAAIEDELRHPLGVAHRELHGHRAALADGEQRKALDARGVDDRLQVGDQRFEGDVLGVPV